MSSNTSDDDQTRIITPVSVCMALALIATAMRFASRRVKHISLLTSDYLSIIGLLCACVVSSVTILQTYFGLGLHVDRVSMPNIRKILLTTFLGEISYSIGFTFIKLSILALYRHIFPTRFIKVSSVVLGTFILMWGISGVLVIIFSCQPIIFSCQPIHGFWDSTTRTKCVDSKWFFIGNSIPNIIADVILLLLPMRDIWKLQLHLRSKIAVSLIFLLGSFVIIASGLRLKSMLSMNEADMTWSYVGIALWSAVEIDLGVVSCCLPVLRPMLAWLIPEAIKNKRAQEFYPLQNN
ncbi:hypothetical protein VM1G_11396 [Cytospora mali]|uniref:Rhodopsin domain-containing protein n=1 Tax=Cytospora mali TaxID=578113 RepID=A0A194VQC4_CYTMA|nr:hypothetical protein VM1G_11396 [Valsa mali]